ncbi:MAG TPA: diaminopimelate epimerase, partial [Limnochordia bacterium]
VDGTEVRITAVSMGNPHCVLFVPDVESAPVSTLGPRIEHHPLFPERVNVEFVEVASPTRLRMRVWERGSQETWACGTGACAASVAAARRDLAERSVTVELIGGPLQIEWASDGRVFMTGPAEVVCRGELAAGWLADLHPDP